MPAMNVPNMNQDTRFSRWTLSWNAPMQVINLFDGLVARFVQEIRQLNRQRIFVTIIDLTSS
jgi:hypothetical protein